MYRSNKYCKLSLALPKHNACPPLAYSTKNGKCSFSTKKQRPTCCRSRSHFLARQVDTVLAFRRR